VLCAGALERDRAREGIARSGLGVLRWVEVIPRAHKRALIDVYVLRTKRWTADTPTRETLVVRTLDGQWTPEFARVRDAMGIPSAPPDRPSR
jgi:hypothetical protein